MGVGKRARVWKSHLLWHPPNPYFLFWQCFSLLTSHIIKYLPKQNCFYSTALHHVFTALRQQQFLLSCKTKCCGERNISFCKFLLEQQGQSYRYPRPLCLCPSVYTTSIAWNNKALTRRTERSTGAAQQREQRQPKRISSKPWNMETAFKNQEPSRLKNGIRVLEIIQFSFLNRINY